MNDLRELYQEVILDHNQNPQNFGVLQKYTHSGNGFNPLCGDKLSLMMNINDLTINEIRFNGSGCAISKASASIMTTIIKGITITEAKLIFKSFHKLVTTGEVEDKELGKLSVMAGVHKYPARVKCATLPWHTLYNCLSGSNKIAKTE
tara:strand:- start:17316 stop:17759 length:444 start_codon:yes stop_codon:yes gene_type:complete